MTFDFALGHQCPHVIVEERVSLSSDRRSLRLSQPIGAENAIRITASGGVEILRDGTLSSASLKAAIAAPFNILPGRTEIKLSCPSGELTTNLPVGTRIPGASVVRQLSELILSQGLALEVSQQDGFLQLLDKSTQGPASFVRVGGPALEALGFTQQIQARGKQIYPPWFLADTGEEYILGQNKKLRIRFPRFAAPVRQSADFKVSYVTYLQWCRRCQGYGQETDIRATQEGEYAVVRNEDHLIQDLIKITATEKGSNPFFTQYGTTLLEQIGTKSTGAARTAAVEDLSKTLRLFQNLQRAQSERQNLTPRQRLVSITAIQVEAFELDPRVLRIKVTATNASGEPVQITSLFAPPGVTSLVGNLG